MEALYIALIAEELMVKFSKKEREEFNKSWKEVLDNSIENINKKDTKGRTILHYAVGMPDPKKSEVINQKGSRCRCSRCREI